MDDTRRKEIYEIFVREERGFVLRVAWAVVVGALLTWGYSFFSSARYGTAELDSLGEGAAMESLEPAFDVLKTPNFFSGIEVPETLVPDGEPLLESLTHEEILQRFVSGDYASHFQWLKGKSGGEVRALWKKADEGSLGSEHEQKAREIHPDLADYLALRNTGYDPSNLKEDAFLFCQRYAPCLAGVMERRYPDNYNALVLLFRFARSLEFTERTIGYSKKNLGFYIAARKEAYARGFPSLKSDGQVLEALRDLQRASVRNAFISAIFLF